jgi:transcriptional regulator with XRE-family HTH domain
MVQINPERLEELRKARGLSQAELGQRSKIDKQTISRIENGSQGKATRSLTLDRLGRALGVERGVLTGELPIPERVPTAQKPQSKISLTVQADNFLYLIAERYFVRPWQVIELAPLLFCWAAEMSLRERRERLRKLEGACASARALEKEMTHLPDANFDYSEAKIAAESRSIDANDIFGICFGDDDFLDGHFYPSREDTENPFATFLAKLTDDISDMAKFEGFSSIDYPIYEVCREEAKNMVGGDEALAERILTGVAALNELPKELRGIFGKVEDRSAWVRAQAEAYFK